MEPGIFSYIRRYSWRQQIALLALTVASLPFFYLYLNMPKVIVDHLNAVLDGSVEAASVLGVELDATFYLWLLSAVFLFAVICNQIFKYVINVYKGVVGERMLRRLRYQLYTRVMRFPLPHFRRVSQGQVVQMINAEAEPLGGFIGDAFALPAFQGGMLLTALLFLFVQDPIMGFAAVALYPIQIYIIPKLQRQVNELGKRRVRQVREIAERIGETTQGTRDMRANDTTQYEGARFSKELEKVFYIRFEIYKKKFFIKFLNNFIQQLGPFFFYAIGGYLVIQGEITIGALIGVINAHKELYSPWKELLTYYQLMSDARIKYEQVIQQFAPAGMRDEACQTSDPEDVQPLEGEIQGANVTIMNDDGEVQIDGINFTVQLPTKLAIVGRTGAGKEELCLALANLLEPSAGRLQIGGRDIQKMIEAISGRQMTFVGYPAQVFQGSIEDNLLYGLKHRPLKPLPVDDEKQAARDTREAKLSGNSPYSIVAEWVDDEAGGVAGPDERNERMVRVLELVRLAETVYGMGLRGTVSGDDESDLTSAIMRAREAMRERLDGDERLGRLVETFDPERYNDNATLAENLMFGTPADEDFAIERLAEHPHVKRVLDEAGLTEELRAVGYRIAATMVELFADLPPDHEYFRQFNFIGADDLPEYKVLVGRATPTTLDQLSESDRERLLSLPFKMIPARHRLGLIDDDLKDRLIDARKLFRDRLPEVDEGKVGFFDPQTFNSAASIQDNILFGKVAHGQAQAADRVGSLITEIIDELGLRSQIVRIGLRSEVGVGGVRLSAQQRQKLAIGRAVMKRPEVLILFDAVAPLDRSEQIAIIEAVLEDFADRTVIWAFQNADRAKHFDEIMVLEHGQIVETGPFDELVGNGGQLSEMVAAS